MIDKLVPSAALLSLAAGIPGVPAVRSRAAVVLALNCGIGPQGFLPGNTCAKGGYGRGSGIRTSRSTGANIRAAGATETRRFTDSAGRQVVEHRTADGRTFHEVTHTTGRRTFHQIHGPAATKPAPAKSAAPAAAAPKAADKPDAGAGDEKTVSAATYKRWPVVGYGYKEPGMAYGGTVVRSPDGAHWVKTDGGVSNQSDVRLRRAEHFDPSANAPAAADIDKNHAAALERVRSRRAAAEAAGAKFPGAGGTDPALDKIRNYKPGDFGQPATPPDIAKLSVADLEAESARLKGRPIMAARRAAVETELDRRKAAGHPEMTMRGGAGRRAAARRRTA